MKKCQPRLSLVLLFAALITLSACGSSPGTDVIANFPEGVSPTLQSTARIWMHVGGGCVIMWGYEKEMPRGVTSPFIFHVPYREITDYKESPMPSKYLSRSAVVSVTVDLDGDETTQSDKLYGSTSFTPTEEQSVAIQLYEQHQLDYERNQPYSPTTDSSFIGKSSSTPCFLPEPGGAN